MTVDTDTVLIKHLFLQFSQTVIEITYNENMFLHFSSYAIYLYLFDCSKYNNNMIQTNFNEVCILCP